MIPDADVEALESELDNPHKGIVRPRALIQHSPARKVTDTAKDNRTEVLEREWGDLLQERSRPQGYGERYHKQGLPSQARVLSSIVKRFQC